MVDTGRGPPEKIDQEILDAKRGVVASVSRYAAARYLGMSPKSLWLLLESGHGPPHQKGVAQGRALNQRVRFPFAELEMWHNAQTLYPHPRKRRLFMEEAERAKLRQELWDLEQRAELIRARLRASGDNWVKHG